MNMKNKVVSIAVVAVLAGLPSVGLSQVPSFGSLGSKLTGGGDLSGQQTSLLTAYIAGGKDVLSSQAKLLEALGLKDQAASTQATADALTSGATEQSLKDADKAESDNSAALSTAMSNQSGALDAQSKKTYTQGLVLLASGLIKYTGMKQDVANFSKGLSGPAALQAGSKLQSGVYIVKTLPTSTSNTASTLNSAVSFAKSHGIEVPSDATAALKP